MKRIICAVAIALLQTQLIVAETAPKSEHVWMMVQHDLADFDAWREVFDSGLSTRKRAGEISYEINTHPAFPDAVIAIFAWDTAVGARAFVDDPAIRIAMRAAGVLSEPIVTILKEPARK